MRLINSFPWLLIYIQLIYRKEFIKYTHSTSLDSTESDGTNSLDSTQTSALTQVSNSNETISQPEDHSVTLTSSSNLSASTSESSLYSSDLISASSSDVSHPPSLPPIEIPKLPPDLLKRINNLDKFQLVDIVAILLDKLTSKDSTYDLNIDLTNYSRSPKSHKLPLTLNVRLQTHGTHHKYSLNDGIDTFTANDGYGFRLIRTKTSMPWHTIHPSEYLQKVELNGDKLTLHDFNGKTKQISIKSKPVNNDFLLDLDLNVKMSTNNIIYNKTDDYEFFTAVEPHFFKNLLVNNKPVHVFGDVLYPFKVVVDLKTQDPQNLKIIYNHRIMNLSKILEDLKTKEALTLDRVRTRSSDKKDSNGSASGNGNGSSNSTGTKNANGSSSSNGHHRRNGHGNGTKSLQPQSQDTGLTVQEQKQNEQSVKVDANQQAEDNQQASEQQQEAKQEEPKPNADNQQVEANQQNDQVEVI